MKGPSRIGRAAARRGRKRAFAGLVLALGVWGAAAAQENEETVKPVLHGRHWVAVAGKPLAATAGAKTFERGGNAVDAAAAMLAASATMWDTLGWGGETQALIHDPRTGEVKGINALGVAPSGATPEFFRSQGLERPPAFGPLAAVTPGTPGGLMVMLAEFGTLSLAETLEPALQMAEGYAIEAAQADNMESNKTLMRRWEGSRRVFLPHLDPRNPRGRAAPRPGEVFSQPDLHRTLTKLVEAERQALEDGQSREEAIMAAYERFYRGDIAEAIAEGTQRAGGLITAEDLAEWQVYVEEPVSTQYKGIDVFKLTHWTQGPALLQMLNILENADVRRLGYNSADYIHMLYQAMNLAFADRDFYYGDPYFPPAEPIEGLLSKEYARERFEQIDRRGNDPDVRPGDPYPFQGESNPFAELLEGWSPRVRSEEPIAINRDAGTPGHDEAFRAGTTSIQAADADGWVVSVTPSGGWLPAFIPGETGIGLSQRMQSFDMDESMNPYNVLEPGKRPRVTLTPSLAMSDGEPLLAFSVQGGDAQEQNLLQLFLNIVEFDMNVQEATEAPNFNSYQVHSSFGSRETEPGRLLLHEDVPEHVREELVRMGYRVETATHTSGPLTAIYIDREHGTLWGGASDFGEDYGIAW